VPFDIVLEEKTDENEEVATKVFEVDTPAGEASRTVVLCVLGV